MAASDQLKNTRISHDWRVSQSEKQSFQFYKNLRYTCIKPAADFRFELLGTFLRLYLLTDDFCVGTVLSLYKTGFQFWISLFWPALNTDACNIFIFLIWIFWFHLLSFSAPPEDIADLFNRSDHITWTPGWRQWTRAALVCRGNRKGGGWRPPLTLAYRAGMAWGWEKTPHACAHPCLWLVSLRPLCHFEGRGRARVVCKEGKAEQPWGVVVEAKTASKSLRTLDAVKVDDYAPEGGCQLAKKSRTWAGCLQGSYII